MMTGLVRTIEMGVCLINIVRMRAGLKTNRVMKIRVMNV
jgi:hypothetical protein